MVVKTDQQETKLHIGTRLNDLSMVRTAISEGCDPNELGPYGWSSLHEAASSGHAKLAIALLRSGGNPNLQDGSAKSSALHLAAKNGHLKLVQVLLDGGAKITLRNVEGKMAEDLADDDSCRQYLARKRLEMSVTSTSQPHQLYSKKTTSPSDLSRQSSRGSEMSSLDGSLSPEVDESSFEPGAGEMRLSFEYNKRYATLKINLLEMKNLMLPTDHNYYSLYVKCYLLPDKQKNTKRKTNEIKIESSYQETFTSSSRSSSAGSESSTDSMPSHKSRKVSEKLKTALRKRHLPTKLPVDRAKCILYGGITTPLDETIVYTRQELHQVDMKKAKLSIAICGRNRWTRKGHPISLISIPLAVGIRKLIPQWYPMSYQINMPSPMTQESKVSQLNQSFESKEDGKYTGRSLAWNGGALSTSSCDVNTTVIRASNAEQGNQALGVGKPPRPSENGNKKHRKHPASKAARFFKRKNSRYSRSESVENVSVIEDTSGDTSNVEFIGRDVGNSELDSTWGNHTANYMNMSTSNGIQTLATGSTEDIVSTRPSLKYSRAFNDSRSSERRGRFEPELSVEELDDGSPFELSS